MTGDIVSGHFPNTPFRVTAILSAYRVAGIALGDTHVFMELSIDDLVPMPVTPEILANNGWRASSGGWMVIDLEDSGIKTRFGWRDNGEFIIGYGKFPTRVANLHHLQHIMRDCGFDTYADNINIQSIS